MDSMTMSLPPEVVRDQLAVPQAPAEAVEEVDPEHQLSPKSEAIPVPPARKNSQGHSHIPKPEISPKPNFLKGVGMTQSLLRTTGVKPPSPQESSKNITAKVNGTANMLKSTLRRMTRLSVSSKPADRSPEEATAGSLSRSRSFREPAPPPPLGGSLRPRNSAMSSSLRRPKNKDRDDAASAQRPHLQRSGTGGTLDGRRSTVNRSHSVTGRRLRDRDLNVRKSRGIQTQLTRDSFRDEEDASSTLDHTDASTSPLTTLEFGLYLPDILGADVDPVETHVIEPTEPADVRKTRQLTLENMKLHREVERLKVQANESDALKKELRAVKLKLEEEQRSRIKIEQQLDKHNEKVKLIVQSMDTVEREFETRDENIAHLETKLRESQEVIANYQHDLEQSTEVVLTLKRDLSKGLITQKTLLQQYQEAEAESNELQEFLSAEKMTLAETLKDCENEISELNQRLQDKDVDIANVEERCSHLVRLSEQRQQEILSLQAQLNGVQERAKDMLLSQGAEISRAHVHIAELHSRLERLVNGGSVENLSEHINGKSTTSLEDSSCKSEDDILTSQEMLGHSKVPRSQSQFLISVSNGNSLSRPDLPISESLANLSQAITARQLSENGFDSVESNHSSLPALSDRISDVQNLIEKFVKVQGSRSKLTSTEHSVLQQQEENLKNDLISSTTSIHSNGHHDPVSSSPTSNNATNLLHKPLTQLQGPPPSLGVSNQENNGHHDILGCKEIDELKSRYMKHKKILMSNYEQAESEIKRLDEIYHDTVEQMLQALETIPEVVSVNPALQQLKSKLQMDHAEGKGHQIEISTVLKQDKLNANQSL
ncbi:putative leucine-rich repeat-containing protein DDB_G0290503 [Tigriopus californicus]|uniref:putative leucine-rich repeat-containing protein DDB_G0290503 n=1 Tax=Tigriopus californicus TaxID=6832 RepID=UPI0027DA8276|nr:putative leucine-rich repeat-containing protein DDB_G0290503 [Tigriopus californicus]